MKLNDLQTLIPLTVHYAPADLTQELEGAYCSDLLSNVMGQAKPGMVWLTMQSHPNIIAVASLLGLAGILLVGGAKPEQETINKAASENIPLFSAPASCFEIAGLLYQQGLRG